ncbi:high-affinity branched-chain amino acid ABC transporter ATP-binding protein LivG [Plasticicumulans acidivorans]|uniref:Branched-chain amino acid transport system ATP-binding protein n=1 Tax=Plasticicumulans acidivorans TaxID=886464 RepID=A0A317N030_9GAMM|nr:high-affinity branched-chain amino acid ABC transporter ATP-binding protein LivG [Plasticicumulans acidivorans]PWV65817.1 branched-chain amino acid transport system ATP-binding protein [Plasticicumulans acidivorans]
MKSPLLTVSGLQMRFGGLLAVDGIEFQVNPGEIFAIIGPNGAGKTTVFNCVSGFYRPTAGEIRLDARAITGQPGHRIARAGIVRTFQNIRLFRTMTAVENLLVAQHAQLDTNWFSGLFMLPRFRRAERDALERAAYWLEKVGLREYANREAGNLAYGQQRRLEIARCMITQPRLLLLDEPAAGLNPQETHELDLLIRELRDQHDVAVLLIEHDMSLVMEISDRILVMEYGRPIGIGTPAEVRSNPRVIKAYLGEE